MGEVPWIGLKEALSFHTQLGIPILLGFGVFLVIQCTLNLFMEENVSVLMHVTVSPFQGLCCHHRSAFLSGTLIKKITQTNGRVGWRNKAQALTNSQLQSLEKQKYFSLIKGVLFALICGNFSEGIMWFLN